MGQTGTVPQAMTKRSNRISHPVVRTLNGRRCGSRNEGRPNIGIYCSASSGLNDFAFLHDDVVSGRWVRHGDVLLDAISWRRTKFAGRKSRRGTGRLRAEVCWGSCRCWCRTPPTTFTFDDADLIPQFSPPEWRLFALPGGADPGDHNAPCALPTAGRLPALGRPLSFLNGGLIRRSRRHADPGSPATALCHDEMRVSATGDLSWPVTSFRAKIEGFFEVGSCAGSG